MTTYHRYGLQNEPVTPMNICGLNPDGYLTTPERIIPFSWLGGIDKCSEEYESLIETIKKNDGTAVGLYEEIAATPQKVELGYLWFENMKPIEGLKIKFELVDMFGDIIQEMPYDMVDLGVDPCCQQEECHSGCHSGGESTFCKFRFDVSGSKGLVGRGDSAILKLTIVEEPKSGLFGNDCQKANLPIISGGLSYRSFCNQRELVSSDGENFSCLDGATSESIEKWESCSRKEEVI